jgi:hypothetical protein
MPQPIQGPTLADVATNAGRREKEIRSRGRVSGRGAAELKKLEAVARQAGASKRDLARQRAIAKEIAKYGTGARGAPSTRRRNALFNESGRIAKRARASAAKKQAAVAKKAAKVKAAKKAAKKRAATAKKAAKKTARPAKKAAKKVARPVKKAAKKSR